MQAAGETEAKGKVEALRMKTKLERDVINLDYSLKHAHVASAETQRNITRPLWRPRPRVRLRPSE